MSRVWLVLQIVIVAPALGIFGLITPLVWHAWFGLVAAVFSAAWLCCQGFSYRRLQQYRRAGG